ncbi:radical SAM/SPASM domain-containing protein [Aestuariivivens insulae]|uniref:radical SAM/SPASM domain-containing protein n=1 Tax=Aestuariivivens insulae TaxID=1621988 RepID=UPI001F55D920|nr:radical SAM protein [Aestuariivivens insulae]
MNEHVTLEANIIPISSESLDKFEEVTNDELSVKVLHGVLKSWALFRIRLTLLYVLMMNYTNPKDWILGIKYLIQLRKKFLGDYKLKKMVKVGSKYYMGLYTPGWNDVIYRCFIASELNHFKPVKQNTLRFNHVHLAITKKCALQCDHCYTWDILNQKDVLDQEDISNIIEKLQVLGTGQIHLTGGEPMLRMDVLVSALKKYNTTSNFWINTSGFKLTAENAKKLKDVGLTGVFISLDHYEETMHNEFRKFKDAYYWAINGAKNAIDNNLVVAFSVCVTKDFVTEKNLTAYMQLAKETGVHFVQFLEPKAVGHYKNKDVSLTQKHTQILESFYVKMNFSNDYLDFPIINYHGYYQRRQGCFAGGNRSIYVDTDGNINACTFCHTSSGNILDDDFDSQLNNMTKQGCPTY